MGQRGQGSFLAYSMILSAVFNVRSKVLWQLWHLNLHVVHLSSIGNNKHTGWRLTALALWSWRQGQVFIVAVFNPRTPIGGTNATSIARCADRVCTVQSSPGAAAEESSTDRILKYCLPFFHFGPRRGIPRGPARARVRGGEKHCHRVAIRGGKTGSPSRARGRASASKSRRNRLGWSATNPLCPTSNCHDSHRHGVG